MHTTPSDFTSLFFLRRELTARGYTFHKASGTVSLISPDHKSVWLSSDRTPFYPFVSIMANRISNRKQLTYAYAEQLGISTPRTLLASTATPADMIDFLVAHAPLVVKPTVGHGGIGMTRGISDESTLWQAVQEARANGGDVLLQKQVAGEEIRFTVLEGKVVSAILRQTPQVVGDGTHTIAELIVAENEQRRQLAFECLVYPQLSPEIIDEAFLTSQEVPTQGEIIELGKSTMVRGGASLYNITDDIHLGYTEIAERFATAINPPFLVVDMLVSDYTEAPTDTNYAFLETNTAPSLRLYYAVRGGEPYDIVPRLADMIDRKLGPLG